MVRPGTKRWARIATITALTTLAARSNAGAAPPEAPAQAQTQAPATGHDATALAKATQNPVSDLVSMPLQLNFNSGGGLQDDTQLVLNFQPVIPVGLGPHFNVVVRPIVPLIDAPASMIGGDASSRTRGLGDIQAQLFVTPSKTSAIIWGIGPTVSLPTATTAAARTGSWAVGPAAVVVKNLGPWVLGALGSQLWTYADAGGDPVVNLFTAQVFANYNFGAGWALSTAPLITANFDAADDQTWTLPVGLGLTKTTVWNGQPMSIGVQYYHNVIAPSGGPDDQLRFTLSFLFPSKPTR
jgi:hypothetical protein